VRPVWRLESSRASLITLGFAAGEGGGGLAELHVAEADFDERGLVFACTCGIFSRSLRASEDGRFRTSEMEWPLKRTASVSEL